MTTVTGVTMTLCPSSGDADGIAVVTANGQSDALQQVYGPRGFEVTPPYFHLSS